MGACLVEGCSPEGRNFFQIVRIRVAFAPVEEPGKKTGTAGGLFLFKIGAGGGNKMQRGGCDGGVFSFGFALEPLFFSSLGTLLRANS